MSKADNSFLQKEEKKNQQTIHQKRQSRLQKVESFVKTKLAIYRPSVQFQKVRGGDVLDVSFNEIPYEGFLNDVQAYIVWSFHRKVTCPILETGKSLRVCISESHLEDFPKEPKRDDFTSFLEARHSENSLNRTTEHIVPEKIEPTVNKPVTDSSTPSEEVVSVPVPKKRGRKPADKPTEEEMKNLEALKAQIGDALKKSNLKNTKTFRSLLINQVKKVVVINCIGAENALLVEKCLIEQDFLASVSSQSSVSVSGKKQKEDELESDLPLSSVHDSSKSSEHEAGIPHDVQALENFLKAEEGILELIGRMRHSTEMAIIAGEKKDRKIDQLYTDLANAQGAMNLLMADMGALKNENTKLRTEKGILDSEISEFCEAFFTHLLGRDGTEKSADLFVRTKDANGDEKLTSVSGALFYEKFIKAVTIFRQK